MSFPNLWHRRKVADSSAKACWICFKSSTTVLITPDKKDFFYVCAGHLQDRGFCTPDPAEQKALEERQKKESLDREVEAVKKEYEEKQKRKKEKKGKGKAEENGEKDKSKGDEDDVGKGEKTDEGEAQREEENKEGAESSVANSPRIYVLQKQFFSMRQDRLRRAEMARKNQERLQNPSLFPAVPKDVP